MTAEHDTNPRRIEPFTGSIDATVALPGSKSLTNRALVCAALAEGRSELEGVLFADDTGAMGDNLDRLGIRLDVDQENARVTVHGCGGVLPPVAVGARLDARLSGTTSRFLLPLVALGPGPTWVDGAPQLRARPMDDGIAALRRLGAEVVEEGEPGHLPVAIRGRSGVAPTGATTAASSAGAEPPGDAGSAEVPVKSDASSQFLSGLLLAAPARPDGLRVVPAGRLVSRPYVAMTAAVMGAFGAEVGEDDSGAWTVAPTGYRATTYAIEPDASAASYFFAAAAICGGRVTVPGLGGDSLQGDLAFVDVLEQMGVRVTREPDATTVESTGQLTGVDVDMADLSDTAQTLAVVAVFAQGPTRVRGIGFIRGKETDRVGNVVRELRRCGIRAEEEDDGFVVHPGSPQPATIQTYADHRMAMSFALLGLRAPGIEIADPDCVAKTFPGFWDALQTLRP